MTKTEQKTGKISAGYFDANRQSPIFVGDVYKEDGAMIPYHKVIKDDEKGFMVEHVGTNEKFLLINEAKNLIKKTYLGNIFDTPDWDELVGHKKETQSSDNTAQPGDSIPEDAPEDVKEFLNGETDVLPEGTEEITVEEAEALEKETTAPADDKTSPAEDKTTENVENNTENDEKLQKPEENNEKEQKANRPAPEIVANTKEEKRLLEKRNDYQGRIANIKRKNEELETEAVRFENLASTLTFEPFVELKMIVSNAVQDYAKKQDIKECEKHLKNYKAIDSMEALLKDYKDLAEKNRANIDLNNKEIDDYEIKVAEINSKLTNFQTKLFDADTVAKQAEDNKEPETKSEDQEKSEKPTNPENIETPVENETKTEEVKNQVEPETVEKEPENPEKETATEAKEETVEKDGEALIAEDEIPF